MFSSKMWRTTTLAPLFVIIFTINQSFSAIFWVFKSSSYIDDYTNSREASFHRGLFLTYSIEQKKLLCQDHFSAQLYVVPKSTRALITDGQEIEGDPQHDLFVSEISLTDDESEIVKKSELFIKCFGKFKKRNPYTSGKYYISYGFRSGRWLASTGLIAHGQQHIILGHNIGTSPDHVPMKQTELEQKYVTIRQVLEELEIESPEYVHLIRQRDDLLALEKQQRAVLCASVLSSPIHRDERLEYSTKWIFDNTDDLVYDERALAFTYNNPKGKKTFICDCLMCKGFADGDDPRSKSTDFCITRSYDNLDSVYVMKPNEDFYTVDKYFKKLAILTNARELFKNYNEKEALQFVEIED